MYDRDLYFDDLPGRPARQEEIDRMVAWFLVLVAKRLANQTFKPEGPPEPEVEDDERLGQDPEH